MFRCPVSDLAELRILEIHHAEAFFELAQRNRAYLRPWLPWVDATHAVDDTRRFIEQGLRQFAANEGFQAGLWHQGVPAGVLGLHRIDWANRAVSLGYWLDQASQGRGLMTAAVKAVVGHLFDELDLHRIEIRAAVENRKSRAIPERLGFQLEGILRQAQRSGGCYLDLAVYSLLRSDPQQGTSGRPDT